MPQCREQCKNQLGKPSGLLVIEKQGAHVVQEASPPPILFQIKTRKKKKIKIPGCQQDSGSPCVTNARFSSPT